MDFKAFSFLVSDISDVSEIVPVLIFFLFAKRLRPISVLGAFFLFLL